MPGLGLVDAQSVMRAIAGGIAGAAALGVLPRLRSRRAVALGLAAAAVVFVVLHQPFRASYPATNDEGSILQDILNVRYGRWPFRDAGGAKGPLALAILAPVVLFSPDPLAAARVLVTVLSALNIVLVGALAARLWDARTGLFAALLAAVTPAVHAQTAQVFLQPFSLPFALGALILLAGHREKDTRQSDQRRRFAPFPLPSALFGAGVLFALAFLARPTTIAFLIPGLFLLARRPRPWRDRARDACWLVGVTALVIGLAGLAVLPFLGTEKTLDFLGWQGVVVGQQRAEVGQATGGLAVLTEALRHPEVERVLRNATTLLRGALPVVILAATFLLSRIAGALRWPRLAGAIVLLGIPLALPALNRADLTPELAGARVPLTALTVGLATIVGLAWMTQPPSARHQGSDAAFFGLGWLALVVGYANYGRFRSHYHAEFLPLYLLAAAAVLRELTTEAARSPRTRAHNAAAWIVPLLATVFVGGALAVQFPIVRSHPHAGNIPLDVVAAVADDLRARTGPNDEIFTAQVLFPALAGRPVPFGISHPGWYREEAFGIVPSALRARYHPDRATLREVLKRGPVRVVVSERRTTEVFRSLDPRFEADLHEHFSLVRTIENPLADPVEIWVRNPAVDTP